MEIRKTTAAAPVRLDMDEVERGGRAMRVDDVIENALAVNDGRGHGFPKSTLVDFIRKFSDVDPKWFDRHRLVMVSYSGKSPDAVNKAIATLVERNCDKRCFISRRKSPNGKSVAFTGAAADEIVSKSRVDPEKRYIIKCGEFDARYCKVEYPMRSRFKSLGGVSLTEEIRRNGDKVPKKGKPSVKPCSKGNHK